jgi:hypothetical protein
MNNDFVSGLECVKICCICKTEKPIDKFGIRNRRGRRESSYARLDCIAKKAREKRAIFGSRSAVFDIEKDRERKRKWNNSENGLMKRREWRRMKKLDPEYRSLYSEKAKEYKSRPEVRARASELHIKRVRVDLPYKVKLACRAIITAYIKRSGTKKSKKSMDLVGCTSEFLRQYLESKFSEGMNWGNYGLHGWHIDHVIPCSSFDLSDPAQQLICFNYNNLQPLWAADNFSKSDRLDWQRP